MDATLDILMEGLIDYAGLFPPAALDMAAAVRNYAAYTRSPQATWLGRFVLPVSRLEEFSKSVASISDGDSRDPPWRLSVLIGKDLIADLKAIAAFNRGAIIDSIEMKVETAEEIRAAMAQISAWAATVGLGLSLGRSPGPGLGLDLVPGFTAYFEVSIQADPAPLLAAIAAAGGRAKVRTGGVTGDLFPSPEALARFLAACARAEVPFKATAGLHHPVRSARPLTYAPDSAQAKMHGFLNVFLAAAFSANGMDPESLADLLREESPRAFAFREEEVAWQGHRLGASQLRSARRNFALAFGSCSFEEPGEDLREAGFL